MSRLLFSAVKGIEVRYLDCSADYFNMPPLIEGIFRNFIPHYASVYVFRYTFEGFRSLFSTVLLPRWIRFPCSFAAGLSWLVASIFWPASPPLFPFGLLTLKWSSDFRYAMRWDSCSLKPLVSRLLRYLGPGKFTTSLISPFFYLNLKGFTWSRRLNSGFDETLLFGGLLNLLNGLLVNLGWVDRNS